MKQLTKKELKKFFKTQLKRNKEIVLVLENLQYDRNVAAIFRTADAAGVSKIYLTGITKTPPFEEDLTHVSRNKDELIPWQYEKNSYYVLNQLRRQQFLICAIELTNTAKPISELKKIANANDRICLVLGSETFGIKNDTLKLCNDSFFIPMYGKGGSLNVSVSTGIALYSI